MQSLRMWRESLKLWGRVVARMPSRLPPTWQAEALTSFWAATLTTWPGKPLNTLRKSIEVLASHFKSVNCLSRHQAALLLLETSATDVGKMKRQRQISKSWCLFKYVTSIAELPASSCSTYVPTLAWMRRWHPCISHNQISYQLEHCRASETLAMRRLQLRSMLMPEVVNQMAALEGQKGKKAPPKKNWSVSADMFPCQLSPDTLSQAREVSLTS